MEGLKSRYFASSRPGSLEHGVVFAQTIQRPLDKSRWNYAAWLTDPLKLPPYGVLRCSYKGCRAATAYSTKEWYLRSYCAMFKGNASDIQKVRVLPDGWLYARVWEHFYAWCPDHQAPWRELPITEAVEWAIRIASASYYGPIMDVRERTAVITGVFVMYAKRRDVIERRGNFTQ